MTDRLMNLGLLTLLGYVIFRLNSQLTWERRHHEEAVQRWRQERVQRLADHVERYR